MRILQLTQHYLPFRGGIELVVHELSKRLAERGHDVEVICEQEENAKKNELQDGVQIHRVLPIEPLPMPYGIGRLAPSMLTLARRRNADVCHVHGYGNFPPWASMFLKRHIVLTPHSELTFRFSLWDAARKIPLRLANAITARTQIEKTLLESTGIESSRIELIRNGVTLPVHQGKDLGIHPMILSLARLETEHKGQDILLKAMRVVHDQVPDARLVVAGIGSDYDCLVNLAGKLGISDYVKFTGELSEEDKRNYLSSCDLLSLAPRKEGFGITYLEAMGLGRPIVTTSVGGIPEVVGDAGLLVPPNDSAALADGIVRALTDRRLWLRLQQKGLERVKKFDWNEIVEKYIDLYERVAES